jgi:ribosomal protein S18 acetylase RimI-like enzyme
MDFNLITLTRKFLQDNVEEFISLNKSNLRNEYWNADHFLAELNRKWDLSFYVTNEEDKVVGFLIASEKEQSIHIHKFVVDQSVQKIGLGRRMLERIISQTTKPVTLKVEIENVNASQFYLKNKFVITECQNNLHSMIYNR